MPRIKIKRNLSFAHGFNEISAPVMLPAKRGTADFKVGKTVFKVLCRNFKKIKKLFLCSAPAVFSNRVLSVLGFGFVPYFPICDFMVKSVCPAFGIMRNYVLAYNRPFFKVRRRQGVILFVPMLNSRSQTVIRLCAGVYDSLQIFIGK